MKIQFKIASEIAFRICQIVEKNRMKSLIRVIKLVLKAEILSKDSDPRLKTINEISDIL